MKTVSMEYELGHGTLGPILRDLERVNGHLYTLRLEDDEPDEARGAALRRATMEVSVPDEDRLAELLTSWRERGEVRQARMEPS